MKRRQKFYLIIKRLIGIFGSLIGIVFCFSLIWWWVFIINLFVTKGHPFFSHTRIGKNGKPFTLFKFRSMKLGTDPNLTNYEVDNKVVATKFGLFLRITSIDESPQLINVLIGDMAFIGPRPLIDKDNDHQTIELRKQNGSIKMRPGISGYAQINGRADVTPELKAQLDEYYYKHFSFWLDAKIFFVSIFQSLGLMKSRRNRTHEYLK